MSEPAQGFLPGCEPQRGDVSSDACFTPRDIIEGVREALGGSIDTDPCWHPDSNVHESGTRYDGRERGDGLAREWRGASGRMPTQEPAAWLW